MQRASFDVKRQVISEATFVQIAGETLPDGGTEGGDSTIAKLATKRSYFCEKEDNVNTGNVMIEEEDVNPNSETYGDFRDVVSDTPDLVSCPLGLPWLIYFGVDDISLDIDNMLTYPITQVSDTEIQVSYDNDGTKYLYMVHRDSLGVIERVYTQTQTNNVVEDWVYLADITINGYLYRVFRTDYEMIQFNGYIHNFVFFKINRSSTTSNNK